MLTFIRPTERNLAIARAAQIYYHKGAYAEKPEQKPEDKKPVVEQKTDQKPKAESKAEQKPVIDQKPKAEQKVDQKKPDKPVEQKPEDKKSAEHKPEQKSEDKKPVEQKSDKPVDQKKPEQKPKAEQKSEDKKPEDQKKPESKPVEQKSEDKKPEDQKPESKPVEQKKPVVEVLDSKGNVVAMLPGVPEEAPKAARTTGTGFDVNNFVTPPKQQKATKNLGQVKNVDEVYSFIRNNAVLRPFDPMPGYSINEKVAVLKTYANFNGTHPGLDVLQINTLLMVFNSPDLSRKFISCGIDPKQVLGVKKFNEVPVKKYDTAGVYDFAFEYTISKKRKLVLLVNSIPTYDEKQGWMNAYSISV